MLPGGQKSSQTSHHSRWCTHVIRISGSTISAIACLYVTTCLSTCFFHFLTISVVHLELMKITSLRCIGRILGYWSLPLDLSFAKWQTGWHLDNSVRLPSHRWLGQPSSFSSEPAPRCPSHPGRGTATPAARHWHQNSIYPSCQRLSRPCRLQGANQSICQSSIFCIPSGQHKFSPGLKP